MKFQDLPKLGEQLDGGIFAGLTTPKYGPHCAVILLPGEKHGLNWHDAKAWATAQGGELPSRPVAALLFSTMREQLRIAWYWTSETSGAHIAWCCNFGDGEQNSAHMYLACSAVAVRLIALEAGNE
jgi:hypothetical protein